MDALMEHEEFVSCYRQGPMFDVRAKLGISRWGRTRILVKVGIESAVFRVSFVCPLLSIDRTGGNETLLVMTLGVFRNVF